MSTDYVIAGLLQGFLEWLPVSSSGQVMIALSLALGVPPTAALRIALALHIGTLFSAIIYYWREVLEGILNLHRWRSNTVAKLWLVATPFSLAIGYPLYKLYEEFIGDVPQDWIMLLIGIPLIVIGAAGYALGKTSWRDEITDRDIVLLGIVQGTSVIPGISRSGVTIALLLFRGVNPLTAVRASFLAGIPAIGAAALYTIIVEGAFSSGSNALIGGLTALISGLAGIWIVEWLAKRFNQYLFTLIIGILLVVAGLIPLIF